VTADLFDNQLMHLAHFKQKVPELLHSLKIDQSYTEKGKTFPCEIDAKLGLGAG